MIITPPTMLAITLRGDNGDPVVGAHTAVLLALRLEDSVFKEPFDHTPIQAVLGIWEQGRLEWRAFDADKMHIGPLVIQMPQQAPTAPVYLPNQPGRMN